MIYKFDILFDTNSIGNKSRYSYSDLLVTPNRGFLPNLGKGYLSRVNNSGDCGLSVQSLFQKYRTLLVGQRFANFYGDEFAFEFSLERDMSLCMGIPKIGGGLFPIPLKKVRVNSVKFHNSASGTSFNVVIPIIGSITIEDNIGNVIGLNSGELAMISAATSCFSIDSDNADVLISCYDD